jgi:hypothetical protein
MDMDDNTKKAAENAIRLVTATVALGVAKNHIACPVGEAALNVAEAALEGVDLPEEDSQSSSAKVGYSKAYAKNYDTIFGKKNAVGQA